MSDQPQCVVYDCNVFIQALINRNGPAGRCVCSPWSKKVLLILSDSVLAEVADAPNKPTPARLGVTPLQTETLIDNLLKVATRVPIVPHLFVYERDPDDAHYINLARAANAQLIISRGRDLLDLMDMSRADSVDFHHHFPSLRIVDPVQFLRELAPA